jgi:hypothetical protein
MIRSISWLQIRLSEQNQSKNENGVSDEKDDAKYE